jgi:pimeloyl-ACP methyl ester carboxylesterase
VNRPERRRFRTSGGELSYIDAGEGPAVVLLHGFPSSSYLWRREIPMLAGRMRVIAPDLLGYGESDKPPGAPLSLAAHAGYIGELLSGLGVGSAALVGHDIGGGVAQLLATSGLATTLVLVDPVAFGDWPTAGMRTVQATPRGRETKEMAERIVRLAFEVGMEHRAFLSPAELDIYVAPWIADPPALFRAARAMDGRGLDGVVANLAGHGMPVFVLWGEEDAFNPPSLAERLLEALPGATVALLPGCGHFVTEDAPTTTAPLIYEFLRRNHLGEGRPTAPASEGPVQIFLERPPADFGAEPDDD